MNKEIKSYIKTEAIISAAFNFFINGMIAALIHHKADSVAMDAISVAVDLTATCLLIFILTALFSRVSLKQTKTESILETDSRMICFLSRPFRHPALFGMFMGITVTIVLFALTTLMFSLLSIGAIPFGVYVTLKCVFSAITGGSATALANVCGHVQSRLTLVVISRQKEKEYGIHNRCRGC